MATVTLSSSIEYGGTKKAYVARVIGPDKKFGYQREFLAVKKQTSRSGKTGHVEAIVSDPGLYEEADSDGDKSYCLVLVCDGDLRRIPIRDDTAHEIAKAIGQGREVTEIEPWYNEEKKAWSIRKDGEIAWRAQAEPATEPAAEPKPNSLSEANAALADLVRAYADQHDRMLHLIDPGMERCECDLCTLTREAFELIKEEGG